MKKGIDWITGHTVELPEMLAGREARAERQKRLLERYQAPLICFTLNVAGPIKVFPLSRRAFYEGVLAIGVKLAQTVGEAACGYMQVLDHEWGHEAYYVVDEDAITVKRLMTQIEETHPFGRLFDIDVLRPDGEKVSRQEIGYPGRACLICGQDAAFCASTRAHTVAELQEKTARMIAGGLSEKDFIAVAAETALVREVLTTPKPGLVDCRNNGAHKDMDAALFVKSARAIADYFGACWASGAAHKNELTSNILKHLRPLGVEAEQDMFEATGGVNTHKGMIFSLGILCGALGYCGYSKTNGLCDDVTLTPQPAEAACSEDTAETVCEAAALCDSRKAVSLQKVLKTAGEIAAPAMADFLQLSEDLTHGKSQYARFGLAGIRGEAASGFRSVSAVGLPAYRREQAARKTVNDAGVGALLALIASVEDSNMIARGGRRLTQELREETAALLAKGWTIEAVEALDDRFIAHNVSPGGCADLLALVYFLDLL